MDKKTDIYSIMRNQASQHKKLYHYTNFDSFQKIFNSQTIRLNRIDKVNDPLESTRIFPQMKRKVFVWCFTHVIDNADYFYNEYGEIRLKFSKESIKVNEVYYDNKKKVNCAIISKDFPRLSKTRFIKTADGGLIEIRKEPPFEKPEDWYVADITYADIFYCNSLVEFDNKYGDGANPGLVKLKIGPDNDGKIRKWEDEKETRLRVGVNTLVFEGMNNYLTNEIEFDQPYFDCLYIDLPEIEEIAISPYLTSENRTIIEDFLKANDLYPMLKC